jgi:hypothetical protein
MLATIRSRPFCLLVCCQYNSIQLFIYLYAGLNGQWSFTESARIQTRTTRQHRTKRKIQQKLIRIDQLSIFTLKQELLKLSVYSQTAYAAKTRMVVDSDWKNNWTRSVTYGSSGNKNAGCFTVGGTRHLSEYADVKFQKIQSFRYIIIIVIQSLTELNYSKGCKLFRMCSILLESVDATEFHASEAKVIDWVEKAKCKCAN